MNTCTSLLSPPRLAIVLACSLFGAADAVAEASWAFAPGAYTHDPQSGVRVVQYAEHEPVEGLPDPRQTVSRYWRTRTNVRGADGSSDTIYEVRSFGNSLGGFDAQRERGFDAQLQTLNALTPFRHNPYLFFGGMQGFGYGTPGYPAATPGTPVPGPQGATPYGYAPQGAWQAPLAAPQPGDCEGEGCVESPPAYAPTPTPYPGMPGTAYPYAPPSGFVAPIPMPYYGFGYGPGFGYGGGYGPGYGGRPGYGGGHQQPWWGYGPGRKSYYQGGGW
ncbi:hypothetical protein Pla108_05330 [Botrimarina colliarenosi]|uniref:Uncharacterized protein n=1 Tax=Botrimarina colliarenosi TaxID=2528001 RepID=A0A5C6AJL8_9BACT|nr:hypothetical protein [Botrimarina colliarenosi]TWT99590.1 hypothetical protein Pla108_05330 [Botrimarina colliarenosi]